MPSIAAALAAATLVWFLARRRGRRSLAILFGGFIGGAVAAVAGQAGGEAAETVFAVIGAALVAGLAAWATPARRER